MINTVKGKSVSFGVYKPGVCLSALYTPRKVQTPKTKSDMINKLKELSIEYDVTDLDKEKDLATIIDHIKKNKSKESSHFITDSDS